MCVCLIFKCLIYYCWLNDSMFCCFPCPITLVNVYNILAFLKGIQQNIGSCCWRKKADKSDYNWQGLTFLIQIMLKQTNLIVWQASNLDVNWLYCTMYDFIRETISCLNTFSEKLQKLGFPLALLTTTDGIFKPRVTDSVLKMVPQTL